MTEETEIKCPFRITRSYGYDNAGSYGTLGNGNLSYTREYFEPCIEDDCKAWKQGE